jgi:hypothetical protein
MSWNEAKVFADWTKHNLQEIQGICPNVSGRPSIIQPTLDISPIWTPVITAEVKKLQLRQL